MESFLEDAHALRMMLNITEVSATSSEAREIRVAAAALRAVGETGVRIFGAGVWGMDGGTGGVDEIGAPVSTDLGSADGRGVGCTA